MLSLVLVCLLLAMNLEAKTWRPNVVLIMVDDLGYYDLGCYGHPSIKTPILDKLAATGIRLTSFYSGATVCTPSRMALLTGSYPTRLGWSKGVIGYMIPTSQGLSPRALTMAEIFTESDYATGLFGKWHLGDHPQYRPHRQGFETSFYIDKSNNQTTKLWDRDDVIQDPFENRLLTEQFTNKAKTFILKNKDAPFFLYLPYTAPHFPVEPHPEFKGTSTFGSYGDVVQELDFRIGEILRTLEEVEIDKQTIVVFLSDNGPQSGEQAQAKPFRGMKWDALEGGTRVPCIVSWPGVIPAKKESNALIAAIDLLPTLTHACGINWQSFNSGISKVDGVNVWDTLIGKPQTTHPRKELLYWHGSKGFHAIRVGEWKLFPQASHAKLAESGAALFHLTNDPEEQINLSQKHPYRVSQMKALAEERLADILNGALFLGE